MSYGHRLPKESKLKKKKQRQKEGDRRRNALSTKMHILTF